MHPLIETIEQFNSRLLELAKTQDWDELHRHSGKRQQALENFFKSDQPDISKPDMQTILDNIIDTDETIKELIDEQKKKSIQEGLSMQHSLKAIKQYQAGYSSQ